MTFIHRRLFFILCVILLPLSTTAQESAEGSTAPNAGQIFDALPMEGTLNQAPQELHTQFVQNPFGIPESQNDQLMELFLDAFETDSLLADARDSFLRDTEPEAANSIYRRIHSDAIQQVLEAEREFYTIEGIRAGIVNRYEMEQAPPAENRQELISSLVEARSSVDSEIESQVIILRGLIAAVGELSGQSFGEAQIDGIANNFRTQMQPQMDRQVREQLMLRYHGIESGILEEYISFYESEEGSMLGEAMTESVHTAYQKASERFIESVRNL